MTSILIIPSLGYFIWSIKQP